MNLYSIIGIVCLALALVFVVIIIATSKKQSGHNLKDNKGKASSAFIKYYAKIIEIPVLKDLLLSIRKRLEIYGGTDENTLRKRTAALFFTTAALFVFLIVIFWILTKDWLMLLLFVVLLCFIGDTVVEIFIHNLQNKLLKQQVYYLEILRHKYYEQKSVEDANFEACNALNKKGSFEVYTQAEKINDILASSEVEAELEKYYETAPNKYFKMLAGILFITKEYGDTIVSGTSVFIRCISYLGSEIKAELYKREKLKYALKSLNIISMIPLFLLKPMRGWASKSFAPLESFYSSKLGIILGIVTVVLSVISYMTLRRLQRFDKVVKSGYVNKTIEQKIYDLGLYKVVDKLVPTGYTQKKSNLVELIKNAMAPLSLYTLYTRRLLYGACAFIVGLVLAFGLNAYTRHAVLYLPQMPQGYLGGRLSDEEYEKLQAIADSDREIILRLGKKTDEKSIQEEFSKIKNIDLAEVESSVIRIKEKLGLLTKNIFWWWELLICFALFIAGYHMPVVTLRFLARVRKIDMEEEVSQFQTIILMLMHMNRVHVEEILEWMETFSIHFKEPLQKCLSNFSSGSYEALEQLKTDVSFPPLIGLIDNLQLACEDLGVERAFEELESEMTFNRETRKESNEMIVERKKNLGNMIGFMPIYAMIVLYLIIPMIVSGMESISAFYRQLSQM